ncbi:MAG: DUF4359 domain-containing protein [Flavobacteriales bacterium]|jgi:hypothetical protein
MIRFIFRTAGMLFIVALIAAYFTNPTIEDFKKEVKARLEGEFKEQLDNPALALIAEEGMDFVADLTEKMVTREEYYFFSIYKIELPTGNEKFVGIFGKFIPLR